MSLKRIRPFSLSFFSCSSVAILRSCPFSFVYADDCFLFDCFLLSVDFSLGSLAPLPGWLTDWLPAWLTDSHCRCRRRRRWQHQHFPASCAVRPKLCNLACFTVENPKAAHWCAFCRLRLWAVSRASSLSLSLSLSPCKCVQCSPQLLLIVHLLSTPSPFSLHPIFHSVCALWLIWFRCSTIKALCVSVCVLCAQQLSRSGNLLCMYVYVRVVCLSMFRCEWL